MSGISIDGYNERASRYGAPYEFRGVVMSLHGILARGTWQTILSPELQIAGFLHIPVDLGYISFGVAGPMALRSARKAERQIRDIYARYRMAIEQNGLSILAHSFGTYCAAHTLLRADWMRVRRIIFVGSIVSTDYPWELVIESCKIERVLNELGNRDRWVRLAPFLVCKAGASGASGFNQGGPIVINKSHVSTDHHSLFDIAYAQATWIPFLAGDDA